MTLSHSTLLVAVAVIAFAGVLGAAWADSDVVQTQYGPVQGFHTDTYRAWLGVPYAASTGGSNRFMPPQPRAPWTAPRNSTWWGPGCVQPHHNADVPKVQSEDCLNLNIFAPASATPTSKLPVMIFFHGGAFVEGSDQGPFHMYDGGYIAGTKPVIVVTSNYRLSAFGWIVTDELKGNQGFRDQLFALHWLQKNIANFGGDPAQVTLWGESAGAMSGGLHLVSPASEGLFDKVIMESNPAGFRYRDLKQQGDYGADVCSILNCSTTSGCNTTCMQQADVKDVQHAWSKAGNDYLAIAEANWGHWLDAFLMCTPTLDGDLIPVNPMQAMNEGTIKKNTSILIGTNNNEGTTFVYAGVHFSLPTFLYQLAMDFVFDDKAKDVLAFYKNITGGEFDDSRKVLSRVLTDYWFRCASERLATGAVEFGAAQAFVYRYDHIFSDSALFTKFGLPAACENATCHGSELPFVFHFTEVHNPQVNLTMTPVEQALSQSFVDYWTSFVIHGNPNTGNSQPDWPAWNPKERYNIVLQDKIATESSLPLCSFWDTVGYLH